MQNIKIYRDYFENNKATHIKRIQKFLQQPCITSKGIGGNETVDLLALYFKNLEFQEVVKIPAGNFPGLWVSCQSGAEKTIANYYMLDTSPASDQGWESPPFQANIISKSPYGEVLMARGAVKRKGPLIIWLNALEAIKKIEGNLPVNIVGLAETDETLGSPSYRQFFNKYKDQIKQAGAAFCPGITQNKKGISKITLGYKGILNLRLGITGKTWGKGPKEKPMHGMTQVLVESPVWRLIHALSILTDSQTHSVRVTDFYADQVEVNQKEKEEIKQLISQLGEKSWKEILLGMGKEIETSNDKLDSITAFSRFFYEPSFNLSGIASGHTGPGTSLFTIPNEAWATFDIRIPRGFSALKTIERIKKYMKGKGYPDLIIEVISYYEPYQNDINLPFMKVFFNTLDELSIDTEIWPYSSGAGPWSLFAEEGIPSIFDLGIGHGGDEKGINEYLLLDNYQNLAGLIDAELFYVQLIKKYIKI